jgi:hypothetical protein
MVYFADDVQTTAWASVVVKKKCGVFADRK